MNYLSERIISNFLVRAILDNKGQSTHRYALVMEDGMIFAVSPDPSDKPYVGRMERSTYEISPLEIGWNDLPDSIKEKSVDTINDAYRGWIEQELNDSRLFQDIVWEILMANGELSSLHFRDDYDHLEVHLDDMAKQVVPHQLSLNLD